MAGGFFLGEGTTVFRSEAMTAADLVAYLAKCPGDMPVFVERWHGDAQSEMAVRARDVCTNVVQVNPDDDRGTVVLVIK